MENIWAIVLAAGQGTRLASTLNCPKQFLTYKDAPLYWQSVTKMAKCALLEGIVIALPPKDLEEEEQRVAKLALDLGVMVKTCAGGLRRQDSVCAALKVLPTLTKFVVIHDAARPFATTNLTYQICQKLLAGSEAVIPGLPVTDTIKVCAEQKVVQTLERDKLYAIQTPQGFCLEPLRAAHENLLAKGIDVTDDAKAMELMGIPVDIILGEETNIKITNPKDLELLKEEEPMPSLICGQGYDVHRFGGTRPLILGGVKLPTNLTVAAHSDGDVLLHALMDALLGAGALGDIGQHFPDSDPEYAGISSAVLLDHVLTLLRNKKIFPTHIDATIIAEKPKIAPYREQIRLNIARLLTLPKESVNIKATTEETLGFTGRLEGLKAICLATCVRRD